MPERERAGLGEVAAGWFWRRFPGGPTPAQREAWAQIGAGENLLLASPTGTGKTLAAFLSIIDRLHREHLRGRLAPGLRCVYISPLKSLGYDIERNLAEPLEGLRAAMQLARSPVRVGVRTGDTSAYQRRRLRIEPPHLLITTPESLALLLSQPAWHDAWRGVELVIVDEVHALVPNKRGADLCVSLERLAARAQRDPARVGLSATCLPVEPVAAFLVGPTRTCRVVQAGAGLSAPELELKIEALIETGAGGVRRGTYRRLLERLTSAIGTHRTTLVFANTRGFTERLTHDLRRVADLDECAIAAHHSALRAERRREVEANLKAGALCAVVSSTSLELGVDIGSIDLAVQVGLPGSVARLLQRVGRAGHRLGAVSQGLLLAATPAELAGAAVTAHAARLGQIEPLRAVRAPLDVLCQQLVGMACAGDCDEQEAFALVRKAGPMAELSWSDYEDCLAFLAGTFGVEPGAPAQAMSPRIWRQAGRFGLRSMRVRRWLWRNIGTIYSEEAMQVLAGGMAIGSIEAAYAERLKPGDRFVLDGKALEFQRIEGFLVHARATQGEPDLPRWSSDRQGLTRELAQAVAQFRERAADLLATEGSRALERWLAREYGLSASAGAVLEELLEAQERASEVPRADLLLVEQWPHESGFAYAFHAPLGRPACEALAQGCAARIGKRFGRNLALAVADLGWSIRLEEAALDRAELARLIEPEGFAEAVLESLERSALLASRFRRVASTGLMVLRNPDGGRRRVGGLFWVSQRLYPLLKSVCPNHPLLRETRREVLDELLDCPAALDWLHTRPQVRLRVLDEPSPFTAAWIDPAAPELVAFETPAEALKRLHARLVGGQIETEAGETPAIGRAWL